LQAYVLGVELGQRLVCLDPLPLLYQAFADFASDAERQLRLQARAHLARVTVGSGFGWLRLHHQRGARRGRGGGFLAAGRQEQHGGGRQGEGQGMTQHDESFRDERIEYLYWRVY